MMKVITKKQARNFSWFLFLGGIGGLWLTWAWYGSTLTGTMPGNSDFVSYSVLYYYIFNSALLILLWLLLGTGLHKAYSLVAIVLAVSVSVSFFILDSTTSTPLFVYTVLGGLFFGSIFGGLVLVPIFLIGVYLSAVRAFQYFYGGLAYAAIEVVPDTMLPAVAGKSFYAKMIPIVSLIVGGLMTLFFGSTLFYSGTKALMARGARGIALFSIALVIFSLFSLVVKKPKIYRILNIIVLLAVLFTFLEPWIQILTQF